MVLQKVEPMTDPLYALRTHNEWDDLMTVERYAKRAADLAETLDLAPTEAGRLGDLGIPNQRSVGVLTVRHTSRMVYQGKAQPRALTSGESK